MKFQRRWMGAFCSWVPLAALLWGGLALADDFAPPSWRPPGTTTLAPASVVAEWDFSPTSMFPAMPTQFTFGTDPDGPSGPVRPYELKQPLAELVPLGGMMFGTTPSDLYTFCIPNWIDDFALKCIRIQLTYTFTSGPPFGAHPQVKNIMAFDPVFEDDILNPMGMVPPGNITNKGISTPSGPGPTFGQVSDWQIIPNPDWEKFEVHVPVGIALNQVFVDTISIVPEPSAVLFGGLICATVGLTWTGRRVLCKWSRGVEE